LDFENAEILLADAVYKVEVRHHVKSHQNRHLIVKISRFFESSK